MNNPGLPNYFVKTFIPAMQVILTIIYGKAVFLPVKVKCTFFDSVSIPSYQGVKKEIFFHVLIKVIKAKEQIFVISTTVGRGEGDDPSAVGNNLNFHSPGIGQGIQIYCFSIGSCSKFFLLY